MSKTSTVSLGEVVDLLTGNPFKSSEYVESEDNPKLLRGDNVAQGRLRWDNVKRWPKDKLHGLEKYSLEAGDVVLAMDRPWIEAGLKYGCLSVDDLPAFLVQRVARMRGTDLLRTDFLRYLIGSKAFTDHVLGVQTGTAVPHISAGQIRSFEFDLPKLEDQEHIATYLGALDDKIELNRRMNETLEEMARALFRDWFVDFGPTRRQMEGASDPTAIMGHAFPFEASTTLATLFPAKLGDDGLPDGWAKRALHDLSDWINGAAYKNMHFSNEPDTLPVIKIAELKAGVTKTTKHTNTALGEKYRIQNGEVLFSWSGNPDTSIDTFIWSGGDAWLNQHIFAVRPNGEVHQAVLYFLLKYLRPQFAEIARDKQTTGLGHVTKQDLKGMRVCLGPDDVESAATEVFSPLFAKLYANQQENRILADMRDLLLPKLMSGEIRLKDAEAAL